MKDNSKEKVLLVHNFYQIRGGEDTVFEQEKNMLIENGHEVIEYTRHNDEIKNMNVIKKLMLPFTTIFSFKTYREVKRLIKDKNINIIHIHNTLNLVSPSIYYAARKMHIPVVQTIHNFRLVCPNGLLYRDNHICEECPNNSLKCAIKHNCYRNSKLQTIINVIMLKIHRITGIYKYVDFIFLTEFNKDKFLEFNKKDHVFDEEKFYVKPNFINIDNNNSNQNQKREGYIYVGRLDISKGIKEVVEAWSQVKDEKLTICGTGDLENELRAYIQDNNLNIEMLGKVSLETVYELFSKSKAFIFSSLWYEGFPMVILESLACNTPVITRDIGNASRIVDENKGLKYDNIEELIKIINEDKISQKKYNIEIDEYTKTKNYSLLKNIYEEVMNNGKN